MTLTVDINVQRSEMSRPTSREHHFSRTPSGFGDLDTKSRLALSR